MSIPSFSVLISTVPPFACCHQNKYELWLWLISGQSSHNTCCVWQCKWLRWKISYLACQSRVIEFEGFVEQLEWSWNTNWKSCSKFHIRIITCIYDREQIHYRYKYELQFFSITMMVSNFVKPNHSNGINYEKVISCRPSEEIYRMLIDLVAF